MLDRQFIIERQHNGKYRIRQKPLRIPQAQALLNRPFVGEMYLTDKNGNVLEFDTEEAAATARARAKEEEKTYNTSVVPRRRDGTYDDEGTFPRSADPRSSRG